MKPFSQCLRVLGRKAKVGGAVVNKSRRLLSCKFAAIENETLKALRLKERLNYKEFNIESLVCWCLINNIYKLLV